MADLENTPAITMNGTSSDSEPIADSPKTNGSSTIEEETVAKIDAPAVEFAESHKIIEHDVKETVDNVTTTNAESKDADEIVTDNGNTKESEDDASQASAEEIPELDDEVTADDDVDSHTPTLATVPEDSQESAAADEDENEADPMDVDAASNHSSAEAIEEAVVAGAKSSDEDTMPESTKTDEEAVEQSSVKADGDVSQEDEPEVDKVSAETINDPEEEDGDVDDDDEDEPMTIDEAPSADNDSNLDENEVEHIPIVQEVHELSDSDDEVENSKEIPKQKQAEMEQMEVDGVSVVKENGHTAGKDVEDDDKPVSIGSDSDEEDDKSKVEEHKNGVDKPTAVAKDYEDTEEDCVVIEDDDKSAAEDLSPRRSGRARKSVVRVREFSSFDQDIEEVIEDPLAQPAAKKAKNSSPSMNITIQDARSLAVDPLATSFQNQYKPSIDGSKKEPTLVLIDTNSIMNRANAASVQALQNQNITVHPVSGNHQSTNIYPTSMRASITPVMPNTNNIKGINSPNTSVTAPPLLPALTDDMFVLEAPSFIVPYIYEKPPGGNLREIVETIRKELAEQKKQEDVDVAEKEAKELEAMSEEQRKLAELAKAADANKKKSSKKKAGKSGDDSWDESDTSTDDEASDSELRTKVLIKEADNDMDSFKNQIIQSDGTTIALTPGSAAAAAALKRDNYFESPLGKFFMDIGINLVQEQVQTDLLRQQKKKLHREGESAAPSVEMAINSLKKNLEHSKLKNKIFKFESKRCEYCNFKSESALAMAHHYEAPHLNGQMYKCNFCAFEARPPYDILFHMEAIHNIKARLEKAQTYHQCPNCPFEDNGKSKLARHALVCVKKFRPEINLNPPVDWEPPAKIPRIKPRHGLVGTATAYQVIIVNNSITN